MSLVTEKPIAAQPLFNVPNQLTVLRLLLSIVLFVFIAYEYYLTSLALFVIAASTDWLDGYWARKYGQVTNLGRILDPFVDKIIICGAFIFLVPIANSGVVAWMAVVIVGRELLVTALRSYLEGEGADFSANMAGKLKMVVQCLAVVFSLYALSHTGERPTWLQWGLLLSVWGAILLTLYSGLAYIQRAVMLLRASR
jgi:CDP-diacylglycerol---glycerol-3-phosphate 3-phosphatidyltransferase